MRAYIITTGAIFALVVAAHIWRAVAEGPELLRNPLYVVSTTLAAALSVWAWRVLKRRP
jgi:hypothetical protein